ncbi:MAG: hypothetical protein EXR71_02675 [Myxococcales bacterium]|nr:hypothetical protein [Myxococcales bacterium]
MNWSALGEWGLAALGIAVLGLPVQTALGFALGVGRRVPVAAAIVMPVAVLGFGLFGVGSRYGELQRSLWELSDPAWAPWFLLYDRAEAAAPLPLVGALAVLLAMPALVGAAVAAMRHERRGNVGPICAAGGGLVAGLGMLVGGVVVGRPALALPGLLVALLALLAAGSLAAVRPRYLSVAGVGVGAFVVAVLGLVVTTLGGLEIEVTELLSDLNLGWTQVDQLARHDAMARRVVLVLFLLPVLAFGSVLPGLGAIRARDAGPRRGLDVAASGAMLGGLVLAIVWVLLRRSLLGRLGGAHAAWVLAAGPGYDIPREDVLPPRVLVLGESVSQWVELTEGGGVKRTGTAGTWNEVGHGLAGGDGVIFPSTAGAEDLYLLLVDAPASNVSLVGCAPLAAAVGEQVLVEPLLAVGRCGAYPLKLRVAMAMPDPRELILVPGPHVQDGLDVIDLNELVDIAGRDVVLRLQVDCSWKDVLAGLEAVSSASAVYLGWGVTVDGDDLAIGVEPGLRVVERMPVPAAPPALDDPAAGASGAPAAVVPEPAAAPGPPSPESVLAGG